MAAKKQQFVRVQWIELGNSNCLRNLFTSTAASALELLPKSPDLLFSCACVLSQLPSNIKTMITPNKNIRPVKNKKYQKKVSVASALLGSDKINIDCVTCVQY